MPPDLTAEERAALVSGLPLGGPPGSARRATPRSFLPGPHEGSRRVGDRRAAQHR
jgi:hypothetical protein